MKPTRQSKATANSGAGKLTRKASLRVKPRNWYEGDWRVLTLKKGGNMTDKGFERLGFALAGIAAVGTLVAGVLDMVHEHESWKTQQQLREQQRAEQQGE